MVGSVRQENNRKPGCFLRNRTQPVSIFMMKTLALLTVLILLLVTTIVSGSGSLNPVEDNPVLSVSGYISSPKVSDYRETESSQSFQPVGEYQKSNPINPHEFYGPVNLTGNPAPIGTTITATIDGNERGRLVTTVEGYYGDYNWILPRLSVVAASSSEIGKTILFFVNGIQTNQTAIYASGDTTCLPLDTPIPPVASFLANLTSGKTPLTIQFTDTSTNTPTFWSWTFGDGSTSSEKNPDHTYSNPGTYTVALTATNAAGSDTETKADYITVTAPAPPEANFSGTPRSGTAPLTVSFTDLSTNTPTSWSWTFGDGSTSTEENPGHEYTSAGTYSVSLTVENSDGSDTETKADYITVTAPAPPSADFSGTPRSGTAPLTVSFTDLSTNTPTSWSWTFGDGSTSTEENPDHEYTSAGTYSVSLTVENSDGSDIETKADYITVTAPAPPSADFSGTPRLGTAPLSVSFTDLSTNSPISWSWTFGDGSTSTEENPDHEYASAGTYSVSLTVENSDGSDTETKADYITVTAPAPPSADFSGTPRSGTAPLTVSFTDLSTNTPTAWSWTFGDGSTSTEENPGHEYTNAGTYSVSLTVQNADGSDTETKADYITVSDPETGYNLLLQPGWNFISVPKTLEDGQNTPGWLDQFVDPQAHSMWGYNGETDSWVHMTADDPIIPLDGYWLWNGEETTVPLTFKDMGQQLPPTKNLFTGWNAIGFSATVPATARDTLLSVQEEWMQSIGFTASHQTYDTAIINGGSGEFADTRNMYPGHGYWLYMDGDGILSPLSG